jgi:hypothetical protein
MSYKWIIYQHSKTGEKYVKSKHKKKEAAINKATQLSLKRPNIKYTIEMELK